MIGLTRYRSFLAGAVALALSAGWNLGSWRDLAAQSAPAVGTLDSAFVTAFKWRSVGPDRGGRSIAVSGVKGRPKEAYFGAAGGGLWKTTDSGTKWAPVTDGLINSSSVGAVAVSESNPDVVYIGMGEACIRGNIMAGDGVYKSTDAGKTWTNVGFHDSDAISKIRIHPTNPDIVFVADFGRYGKDNDERGVFKTIDGGKNWKKVLFRNAKTGAVDVAIDRKNPSVVYAALWEAYRVEYQMSSGGPGSGFFKSTDGGETWKEITRNPGLPTGMIGKIGIALTAADSNRVYALIENENGGLLVSDDAGATWKMVNTGRNIRQRAFYYTHVFADHQNKDIVYALNTSAFRSVDGGKTFQNMGNGTHGDHHDIWIDPDDPQHVVLGNDGGGAVTFNVGAGPQRSWSDQGFPTEQFYHVITTKHVPYHVCGAQQDNSTLCVPSTNGMAGRGGQRTVEPFYPVGGNEDGYIAPDPKDTDVFFSGSNNGSFITRLNRRTGELREVNPYPRFFSGENSASVVERWQWTFPIIFSPVDPTILYTSSQHVWKTTNQGQTWEKISGDLTRHDPKTMQDSGGPITHDMNSPEIYATVFALAPGKTDVNIIWAGSDDGLVHITRDGGKNWTNITPKEMPDLGRVSQIDASSTDPGTAYIAVKKPLLEDFSPYLFRTHDFGQTWTKIVTGLPANDYTHVVREDPTRRGLLYAGTQHGFYVSLDDGDHWQSLKNGLPDTPVHDIWVEARDVAIATHGRGFYILDDVAPLRQFGSAVTSATTAYLFKPSDATRSAYPAKITYWLKTTPQKMTLEILDARGQVVRSFNGAPPSEGRGRGAQGTQGSPGAEGARGAPGSPGAQGARAAAAPAEEPPADDEEGGGRGRVPTAPMAPGVQHFTWDLQYAPVTPFQGMVLWGATTNGPLALPGGYQARLTVDGQTFTQPITVKKHPLYTISDADMQAQFDLASRIRDKVNEANDAIIQIRRIKTQLKDRTDKNNSADAKAIAEQFTKELSAVEEDVYQVRNQSNQDPLNFPIKTNNRLASLLRVVSTGEGRPIGNAEPIFEDLQKELKAETDRLQRVLGTYLPRFNTLAQRIGMEPISEK